MNIFEQILCALKEFLVWLIDGLGWIMNFLLGWLLMLLPNTPFVFEPIEWGAFGQLIGYFIPVADMFTHLTLILVAVGLYYLIRHLLRVIRMVQ